ncbi:MAG: sortase [Nocardioides sp.]|uniref:sortase domain-containing protein n=1 Tax=Nocardioides sp. TaxID=35761 RepID=UPI0039E44DC3
MNRQVTARLLVAPLAPLVSLLLALGLLGAVDLSPASAADTTTPPPATAYSDGTPRDARITIPSIGIKRLKVIAYEGKTDDWPGTKIQNRGIAASPYGSEGGIGPGGIGNYQVTAHRISHGGVFRKVPTLHKNNVVFVDVGHTRYIYRIIKERWVDFRSAASLRAQRAEVPGHPGVTATRGYITISTCATPEDHARGNYWTDKFGNPQHRIDEIGVLVGRVQVPARYFKKKG